MLDLGLQAAAAERAFDFPVRIKQRLRAEFLRAGTFHAGDDAERDGFVRGGSGGKRLENRIGHAQNLTQEKLISKHQAPTPREHPSTKFQTDAHGF